MTDDLYGPTYAARTRFSSYDEASVDADWIEHQGEMTAVEVVYNPDGDFSVRCRDFGGAIVYI